MTTPFISIADLEALLGEDVIDTDLIVAIALDASCEVVRTYLGQTVNLVEDDTAILDGNGRDAIRLPERPVRAVAEVREDAVIVDPTTYIARRSLVIRNDGDTWTVGRGNIEVDYDHGWDIGDPFVMSVPADIRLVALSAARRIYVAVGALSLGAQAIQGETIGAYSYTLAAVPESVAEATATAGALLPLEQAVLDPYRVLGVTSGSRA
jgi:hypothetical protein